MSHADPGAQAPALSPDLLPIVLVGLPGAGKTTVARLLATSLGVQVTDTDAEIRRRARMTVPQIFASEGEAGFRERETRALRYVLLGQDHAKGVVALGGGAVEHKVNRALLAGRTVVYLHASPQTAAQHVGMGEGRPLMGPGADSDETAAGPQGRGSAAAVLSRMRELYERRRGLYEQVATLTVPTDGLSPQQVAALILVALGGGVGATARCLAPLRHSSAEGDPAASGPQQAVAVASDWPGGPRRVRVQGTRPYDVLIGHDLDSSVAKAVLATPGHGQGGVALVHARPLATAALRLEQELAGAGLRVSLLEVSGDESCKTSQVLDGLWERMGQIRLGRDGVVVALGGGATTDLAGLAAATWLRGLALVQVPTSLLAMVDAAVGGKTGVNTSAGKNLVGAFHQPAAVVCDLDSLRSLPPAELRAGIAEAVKCGLIADPVILDRVLADPGDCLRWDAPVLAELVERAVLVKAEVVSSDPKETGLREVLNYGHTYGHAIERATGYRWRHGEAVAVGCVFAAEVAHRRGMLDADTVRLHRQAFEAVGLPTSFPLGEGRWEEMWQIMGADKKVRAGSLRMVLLEGVGLPCTVTGLDPELLRGAHQAVTRAGAGERA